MTVATTTTTKKPYDPGWAYDTDLAYAAGFFDGEGHISIVPMDQGNLVLRVGAAQGVIAPLVMLRDLFGGSINIAHPGRNYVSQWVLGSTRAANFLRNVMPYLMVKQEQAELAIAFQGLLRGSGYRHISPEEIDQRWAYKAAIEEARWHK